MTEKEMIEEMAKVLETKIVNKTWRSKSVARELYRMVIPEGAVVLTKEEYIENDRLLKLLEEKRLDELKSLHKIIEKDRKETAREIIDMLIPDCEGCEESLRRGCMCLRAKLAGKIAKQYGTVEVEVE